MHEAVPNDRVIAAFRPAIHNLCSCVSWASDHVAMEAEYRNLDSRIIDKAGTACRIRYGCRIAALTVILAPLRMCSTSAVVLPKMLYLRPRYRKAFVGGRYVSACPINKMLDVSMGVLDEKSNPVISDFLGCGRVPDQLQKDCRRAKHWDMFSSVAVVRVRSSANARCGSQ